MTLFSITNFVGRNTVVSDEKRKKKYIIADIKLNFEESRRAPKEFTGERDKFILTALKISFHHIVIFFIFSLSNNA